MKVIIKKISVTISAFLILMQITSPIIFIATASTFEKIGEDPAEIVTGIPDVTEQFDNNELSDRNVATVNSPVDLVLYAIDTLLKLIGVIAVFFIILGGYYYITARGDDSKAEKGKKIIFTAISGLVIIIAAYTIVAAILNYGAMHSQGTSPFERK